MRNKNIAIIVLCMLLLGFTGCEKKEPLPTPDVKPSKQEQTNSFQNVVEMLDKEFQIVQYVQKPANINRAAYCAQFSINEVLFELYYFEDKEMLDQASKGSITLNSEGLQLTQNCTRNENYVLTYSKEDAKKAEKVIEVFTEVPLSTSNREF